MLEGKFGERGGEQLDLFLAHAKIEVEPVTKDKSGSLARLGVATEKAGVMPRG